MSGNESAYIYIYIYIDRNEYVTKNKHRLRVMCSKIFRT